MTLDDKDKAILKHISEGKSNKETAPLVNVSVKTVEWRLRELRKKLNCRNTVELLLKLQRNAAL